MADTMQFELVSPERKLASVEALSVQIPGAEGEMTAFPNHSALLTTLRPGVLSVNSADGVTDYIVTGGFAEVSENGVTVLAEQAVAVADVTKAELQGFVDQAEADLQGASGSEHDVIARRLADYSDLLANHGS